jgi:beta-1,4-N-acetylglucosaminyltransferase
MSELIETDRGKGTFVSIGNGTQDFSRLLEEVKCIAERLPQPVAVQHGWTHFKADGIECFDFVGEEEFLARLKACAVFITHGGAGSVFSAIRFGKKAVVVPRRREHNEIVDNHQLAFTEELSRQGKIIPVEKIALLEAAVGIALKSPFLEEKIQSGVDPLAVIGSAVHQYARTNNDTICLVTPSGGHLTEIRMLGEIYRSRPHYYIMNTPIVEPEDMNGRTILVSFSIRDIKFFINMWEAFKILRRIKPKVILTTGGGFSVAFAAVGKILKVPTVYIETAAKVHTPTVTGRIMYHLADRFFYQWRQVEPHFPRGEYVGLLL